MKISLGKSQIVAQQIDKLTSKLKKYLETLQNRIAERNPIVKKADDELSKAIKWSKEARNDIDKYLSAVKQASSKVSSAGRADNFLKEASESQTFVYSIDNLFVDASLTKAHLISQNIAYMKSVVDVLKYANGLVAIPKQLANAVQTFNDETKKLSADRAKLITQALTSCQKNAKSARSSNIGTILKIQYAVALYRASMISPSQASEYLTEAKSLLNELLSTNKSGGNDALLAPAKELQEQLTL